MLSGITLAEELSGPHLMRKSQLDVLGTILVTEWPDEQGALFQGIRKEIGFVINSKQDHMKAVLRVPKKLLGNHRPVATIEDDGWFYTSVGSDINDVNQWHSVIASKKGTSELLFSYTW